MDRSTVSVRLRGGSTVDVRLDRAASVTLQEQISEQLKHYVATRRIGPGQQLPSVRRLAAALQTSPVTISRAYAELRRRGLVESRSGTGVFVVDFAARRAETDSGGDRTEDFATVVLNQALRIGIDPRELARVIEALGDQAGRRNPRLLVAIDEFDSVDHLVEQLSAALADDGVAVRGLHLDEVDEYRDLINQAGLIASAPHCYGLVRRTIPHREEDIVGLTMVLGPDVNDRLRTISPLSRVVVVGTQPSFLSWMSRLVRLQVPLQSDPTELAFGDHESIRRQLKGADVVVFGSGVRHTLPPLLPAGAISIELSHVPDAESISNLRALLRAAAGRLKPASEVLTT